MKRAALLYLGIIVVLMAFITGAPGTLGSMLRGAFSSDKVAEVEEPVTAQPDSAAPSQPELVAKANLDPLPVAIAEPVTVASDIAESAASSLAAAGSALEGTGALAKPVVRGGDGGLDQATSAILAELSILPKADIGSDQAQLQQMSATALNGLRSIRGQQADHGTTLEALVSKALKEGQSDAAIDTIVNEAAGRGAISVPSALVTSDGKVDTAVLLANLVTKAQIAAGKQQQIDPNDVVAGGAGVEVRLVSKANGDLDQHQFYTVMAGDSLGAIAVKFYGDAAYFPKIFDANRALLASPDKLNVGQRLVIPSPETL